MRQLLFITFALSGALVFAGGSYTVQEGIAQGHERAALTALHDQYAAAANSQDAARLASLYTSDAIYMPANSPGLAGRDAIQLNFENSFKNLTVRDAVSSSLESHVAGIWIIDRARFTYTAIPKTEGEPIRTSYVVLQILERQPDGSWKIKRRMFHSDQPSQHG